MKRQRLFIKFRDASSKLGDYLDKKGFYIVILLCIIVIGATVSIVSVRDYNKINLDYASVEDDLLEEVSFDDANTFGNSDKSLEASKDLQSPKDLNEGEGNTLVKESEEQKQETKVDVSQKETVKNNDDKNTDSTKKQSEEQVIASNPKATELVKLSYPVYGKVINQYATDKLIYSQTLQHWTTHSGVDISSDEGSVVKAAMDGVVKSIKNDPGFGKTIVIEHNGGIKTIYANLSTADMVKTGQEVKRGQAISGVGSTAIFESEDEAHLHFEVHKDDKSVNPLDYLPAR